MMGISLKDMVLIYQLIKRSFWCHFWHLKNLNFYECFRQMFCSHEAPFSSKSCRSCSFKSFFHQLGQFMTESRFILLKRLQHFAGTFPFSVICSPVDFLLVHSNIFSYQSGQFSIERWNMWQKSLQLKPASTKSVRCLLVNDSDGLERITRG